MLDEQGHICRYECFVFAAKILLQSVRFVMSTRRRSSELLSRIYFQIIHFNCIASKFRELVSKFEEVLRRLNAHKAVEMLRVLLFFRVPINCDISLTVLSMVREQINQLTLDQIMFLDYILKNYAGEPLVGALLTALPRVLEAQISQQIDHENVESLVRLLGYIEGRKMSYRTVNNVVSSLTLHGTDLDPPTATRIIISLCELKRFNPVCERLLRNVSTIMTDSFRNVDPNGRDIKTILYVVHRMVSRCKRTPPFYNNQLLHECAEMIITEDIGLDAAIELLHSFNSIVYVHIALLK